VWASLRCPGQLRPPLHGLVVSISVPLMYLFFEVLPIFGIHEYSWHSIKKRQVERYTQTLFCDESNVQMIRSCYFRVIRGHSVPLPKHAASGWGCSCKFSRGGAFL